MIYQANTAQFPISGRQPTTRLADRRVAPHRLGDCRATGARWKRFLLARATASEREAAKPGRILAGKWRKVSEKIWLVSFVGYDLVFFDHQSGRVECAENPFDAKVLAVFNP